MIDGTEILENEISANPAIHKKLIRLSKIGNYRALDAKIYKSNAKSL